MQNTKDKKVTAVKDIICTHRTDEEKKKIVNRLSVITGQIKGISKMVEGNRGCEEILGQLASVENSLKSVGVELLKTHLSAEMFKGTKNINLDAVDEVIDLIKRTNI